MVAKQVFRERGGIQPRPRRLPARTPGLRPGEAGPAPAGGTGRVEAEDDITSVVTTEHAAVVWGPDSWPRERGVAEASRMPEGYWYVNRVLVEPIGQRSKGLGSRLLQRLLVEVRRFGGAVVVDPGGYGMNTARQRNFYRKNGFREDPETKGRMRYEGGVT